MCLAIPGKILNAEQLGESRLGTVQFGNVTKQVYLDFVPDAQPGDYVLVHVGIALSKVDSAEAERIYRMLEEDGESGGLL